MRGRVGFADGSIKVLETFCGQNLTTKKGDKRLNMYLVEERATATQTAMHCRTQHINFHAYPSSPTPSLLHSLSTMVTPNTIHG
jgi:hypothetical protein